VSRSLCDYALRDRLREPRRETPRDEFRTLDILVIILLPAWGFIGFVIYLLMREPLPYPAGVRYRCWRALQLLPQLQMQLHPSCPQCKHEVGDWISFAQLWK